MLRVRDLEVKYGDFQALWGVSLDVNEGEVVCLLGPNGAGKSTLISAVSGLVPTFRGTIEFCGERLNGLPTHQIVTRGLSQVMEQRRLFPYLTVEKNLLLGSYQERARAQRADSLERVFSLFPTLRERRQQLAYSLSGGEQQMVAIARGLMSRPKFLMIDEPFLGLAPIVVQTILNILKRINGEGVTVLFIEQNVQLALGASHRGYLLESGHLVAGGAAKELLESEMVRKVYVHYHPAGFPNDITDTDDHTVLVAPKSQLTDTMWCPLPNNQFRLLYRLQMAPNVYLLNGSNPGQFYYNAFYYGTPGTTFTMTIEIPYPFMTQEGAGNPIQVHDGTGLSSSGCYLPNPSLSGFNITTQAMTPVSPAGNQTITPEDYTTKQPGKQTRKSCAHHRPLFAVAIPAAWAPTS